ncbi:hypothetical protein Gpo141_00011798 [Globisporangium polare]
MSRPHAQIDLRRSFSSVEDEDEAGGGDGFGDEDNDQAFVVADFLASRRFRHDEGDEDEEVNLEGYEQYLAELKSKAEAQPHSARVLRTLPTESPQFYMVNAHNPSFPITPPQPSGSTTSSTNGSRPTRPMSARPRLSTSGGGQPNAPSSSSSATQLPRAPSRGNLTLGSGVRRRRQGDNVLNARVRAIYNDTGSGRGAPPVVRQMPSSVSATSTIVNKLKVFQQAELHDEYYKLVDVVTELKSACQLEQERRVKAVARIRRLEEIVAMKDRKIEALLHAKSSGGSDHQNHASGSITQRELAHKDRQNNALVLKLKHKIAQQSQLLCSYEEAMQSLRSGIKSTNLMELEEERAQLYVEVRNQSELLACARLELESQNKKINELFQIDSHHRQQITKLQQESKKNIMEKQKCDQEIAFFKTRIEQLQDKLALEQRKRTYDREVSSGNGAVGSNGELMVSPSSRNSVLASALEEMKALMKKECMASIQREKLKSPRPAPVASKSPRNATTSTTTDATAERWSHASSSRNGSVDF